MSRSWLVTGATGFLGRELLRSLQERGEQASAFDPRVSSEAPAGFNVLVHLGARTGIADSWANPLATYESNVLGTVKALEVARKVGAQFIFLSTCAYGRTAPLPTPETAPFLPEHPYGESKYLGEHLVQFYGAQHGLSTVIFRLFNVYGEGQAHAFLIPRLLTQITDPQTTEIHLKNTKGSRDFIHVSDVVSAIHHAGQKNLSGIFNLGTGRATSVGEVVRIAQTLAGRAKPVLSPEEFAPNEVLESRADITRLRATGWEPKITLEEGLNRLLQGP